MNPLLMRKRFWTEYGYLQIKKKVIDVTLYSTFVRSVYSVFLKHQYTEAFPKEAEKKLA